MGSVSRTFDLTTLDENLLYSVRALTHKGHDPCTHRQEDDVDDPVTISEAVELARQMSPTTGHASSPVFG